MEDARLWSTEESLWKGGRDVYEKLVSKDCLMVVPAEPYVVSGEQAIDAVSNTPRWEDVRFSDQRIARPEYGMIVCAYHVEATRGDEQCACYATSTYQRCGDHDWQVVQHQQTVPLKS